jgi:hypothetical protein
MLTPAAGNFRAAMIVPSGLRGLIRVDKFSVLRQLSTQVAIIMTQIAAR